MRCAGSSNPRLLRFRHVYICWKVQDVAVHVPKLEEPGIREQVVKAWKRIEALPLAKKRAEELAERSHGERKIWPRPWPARR